jgi:hypothetical protein
MLKYACSITRTQQGSKQARPSEVENLHVSSSVCLQALSGML